jgi:hypothetical protein
MENRKQNMRQQAAKAFMASLGDFEDIFGETEEKPAPVSPAAKPPAKKKDVDVFEEALADIEAFMEKRSPPQS